jgi:hypothetical protein
MHFLCELRQHRSGGGVSELWWRARAAAAPAGKQIGRQSAIEQAGFQRGVRRRESKLTIV